MTVRTGSCRCGQLRAECTGEPARVSVCHCLACKQRTGSAFSYQARWPDAQVRITGERREWERTADSGNKARYLFCPDCGSTIAYTNEGFPGLTAVPAGCFADPAFPPPRFSVYENRKHDWVEIGGDVDHSATPSNVRQPGHNPDQSSPRRD